MSCVLRQLLLDSGFLSIQGPEIDVILPVQIDEKLPLLNWTELF